MGGHEGADAGWHRSRGTTDLVTSGHKRTCSCAHKSVEPGRSSKEGGGGCLFNMASMGRIPRLPTYGVRVAVMKYT